MTDGRKETGIGIFKLFTKRQNFGLDQNERICGRQNKYDSKIEICLGLDRKDCGKRRKCW